MHGLLKLAIAQRKTVIIVNLFLLPGCPALCASKDSAAAQKEEENSFLRRESPVYQIERSVFFPKQVGHKSFQSCLVSPGPGGFVEVG